MSNPAEHSLSHEKVEAIAIALEGRVEWLVTGAACDVFLDAPEGAALSDMPPQIDAILQPVAGRRKKLLIADMESTLIRNEFVDELAEFVGKKAEVAAITARAMNGELDFKAALEERVALLAGLPESVLDEVWARVDYMPGAQELVAGMKAAGAHCILVSGGFDVFAERVAAALEFDEFRANRLGVAGGKLTGRVIPPVLDKNAKLEALNETCGRLGITPQEAVAVGDGANDLPMLLAAGLGIAYHAKPKVRAAARHRVDHVDLRALLWAQGIN